MIFTKDMKEFLEILKKLKIEYVLVGGFAVNFYGYVRTTQDIDILIFPSVKNARKIIKALQEFGFGGVGISQELFEKEGTAIHLGVEPNRIDILSCLKGVSNADVFKNKKVVHYHSLDLNIISFEDLLSCKRCSSRAKDLADVEELEKISLKSEDKKNNTTSRKPKTTKKNL